KQPDTNACFAVLRIGAPEADERLALRTLLYELQIRRCSRTAPLLLANPDFVQEHAAQLLPHFVALLKDEGIEIRMRSAESLALRGRRAAPAAPALEAALKDREIAVGREAAIALARVEPKQVGPMVAFLVRSFPDPATQKGDPLAPTLARIGP